MGIMTETVSQKPPFWWRRGRVELDYARKPDFTCFFTFRPISDLRRHSETTKTGIWKLQPQIKKPIIKHFEN